MPEILIYEDSKDTKSLFTRIFKRLNISFEFADLDDPMSSLLTNIGLGLRYVLVDNNWVGDSGDQGRIFIEQVKKKNVAPGVIFVGMSVNSVPFGDQFIDKLKDNVPERLANLIPQPSVGSDG